MNEDIEVRTYFARGRNALVARATFSELYAAWYLHRMDCGLRLPPESDTFARDALAVITLHCAGRPWKETCAWTVHFPDPRINVFAAGDNAAGAVVANVFIENIRPIEKGMFYSDVIEDGRPSRRSVVEFEAGDFLKAVGQFYEKSEQRPVRFFRHGDEDLVMVSAQPDCDLAWLGALDDEAIRRLDADVELSLLETRPFRFQCGCTRERMLDFLTPVFRNQGGELFGGKETIRFHCPRCGARHAITREALEAHAARK
ncbi:MAG: Hsp33 family molecular chaperone HslO [Verrucomicrobiae bacterium]